jgi:hypothetical protein
MNSPDIVNLALQCLAGLAGGTAVGKFAESFSSGPIGNTIAGVIGGFAGGSWLGPLLTGAATFASGQAVSADGLATDIAGGGVGGILLTLIVGTLRKMLAGPKSA